ncbi:MAG: YlbF family regulator [Clostridia bacterium]
MNFHDKVYELVACFKQTQDYKEYIKLKEQIKEDDKTFKMVKDFKDKQREHQVKYINGEKLTEEENANMQNLYSIVIQNDKARSLLECEMKLDVLLADMQKIVAEGIKDVIEF